MTVRLRNDRGEHTRLQSELVAFCSEQAINEDCSRQLRLLLEEMFINAATYAYAEGVSGWIDVTLDRGIDWTAPPGPVRVIVVAS